MHLLWIEQTNGTTGELFFYYFPKGIFKRNPINVYEVPSKFNLDEKEYISLVDTLYKKIVKLREEFKKIEKTENTWTNLTIQIEGTKFKVQYDYEDLSKSKFTSYERHIIWRYIFLGIGENQLNREDRNTLRRYLSGEIVNSRKESYETDIYITNTNNIIHYDTEEYNEEENLDYYSKKENKVRNQIIASIDEKNKIKKE